MTLSATTWGAGLPLVLLHGFTGAGSAFDHLREALGARFRATAPDLPANVPSAFDLLENERERKILRALSAAGELGKPLVSHLTVPDERVQILRNAFAAMMKDPAFLADADKLRQNISPTIGDAALKIVEEIYASPADVVEAARAIAIE